MNRWIIAAGAGLLMLVAVSGWGRTEHTARPQDAGAARAVHALVAGDPDAAAKAIPADFASAMGFTPAIETVGSRRMLLRPDGGCSSPFGDTKYGFGAACKQHDLGYDLLRYAQREGAPLGPWARHAVDANFLASMRTRTSGPGGALAADGYWAAVAVNSWRQGYGVPVVEHASSLVPGAAGGLATALALGLLRPGAFTETVTRRRSRRPPRRPATVSTPTPSSTGGLGTSEVTR